MFDVLTCSEGAVNSHSWVNMPDHADSVSDGLAGDRLVNRGWNVERELNEVVPSVGDLLHGLLRFGGGCDHAAVHIVPAGELWTGHPQLRSQDAAGFNLATEDQMLGGADH